MNYAKGLQDLDNEITHAPLQLISGQVPPWLKGTLLRNGPGRFSLGNEQLLHWFDGLAMLHRFHFDSGNVQYSNRFITTRGYTEGMEKQKIVYPAFATAPNYSFLQSIIHWFKKPESGQNPGVSVARLGSEYLALTESPAIVRFDDHTLSTDEVIDCDDEVSGEITTAHPHYDFANKYLINFSLKFGRQSEYIYFKCNNNIRKREPIGRIPVDLPSYIHSFAMSERYIVHVAFPLVANPLRMRFGNVPYIKCFQWKPERGTRFTVLEKSSGKIVKQYQTDACFAFHHVNAYETGDDIIVDMATKPDASVIDDLYLEHLRTCQGRPVRAHSQLQRFILPLKNDEIRQETISQEYLEMPTIHYRGHNGRNHRYVYGIGSYQDRHEDFENQLIKIDTDTGTHVIWYEEDCYPWEPIFVPAPNSSDEDDGVILSTVLDSKNDQCFLLILAAKDFTEMARLALPHIIPLGFHAQFFSQS
jgi:carotenoid cleavage dioxygenase-like enzyme